MADVIYAEFGAVPAAPVQQTNRCDKCEPTFALGPIMGLAFDTEADARLTAQSAVLRNAIMQDAVPGFWNFLWNNFQCTNAQCRTRQSCGPRPTYLAIGARSVPVAPGGVLKWQIMLGVAREIRCVDGPEVPDDKPEIPEFDPLDEPRFALLVPDGPDPEDGFVVSLDPVARPDEPYAK